MGWFEDLSGSSQSQTSGVRVAPETALEQYANPMLQRGLQGFEGLVGAGPGEAQMRAGIAGMEDYARMLQGFTTPEGMFAAQNKGVEQYSRLGEQIFGGQMRQQQQEASRLAGRMGRPTSDPILQAKLAQQRADTVGSFAAQQSVNLPQQLAQFGGQRAEALQGLASQAMANRQALLGMGSQLREQDRSYRINTGERYSNQQQAGSFLGSLGGIAGIAGSVMGGVGALGAGGLIGGGAAKGLAGGAAGGLGSKMSGILGVGGGAQGGGMGSMLGGMGSLLGGASQAARQFGGQQGMGQASGAAAQYGDLPVGQSYDVFNKPMYNLNANASDFASYQNAQQPLSPSRQSWMQGKGY